MFFYEYVHQVKAHIGGCPVELEKSAVIAVRQSLPDLQCMLDGLL